MTEQGAPTDGRYARGYATLVASLAAARRDNLAPPPRLSLSEWAERYAVLSRETSAQTGRFRAYGYQPGIMDAVTDPTVTEVVVRKSARVGYTKILDHVIGYFVHQDPSPILLVQPRVEDAEDYSSTEIEPMLRDTPVLAAIAGDLKAKDAKQKLLKRVFRNGSSITFVGANSPGGFRRITARVILFDEVDGYPKGGAGQEGDQISLGKKRAETFWNSKVVIGSTPTIKGESRIDGAWEGSDQRLFHVACPHCGVSQPLEWGGPDEPFGIKWRRSETGEHLPETAFYLCRSGCVIDEVHKPAMIAGGAWVATKPFKGIAGFHIWAGYSLHVKASWSRLVAEWLEVKADPLRRQTFVNLVLGLPYEDRGDKALGEAKLLARREIWAGDVPRGAAVLTAGLDVQDDRIEAELVGWGRDEESWSIAHVVFEGDPQEPPIWQTVDAWLKRKWRRADGREFTIMAACIDSGGHATQAVYAFAKARLGRRIWAIKGESARGGARSPVWPVKRPSKRTRSQYRPIIIGVNAAKDSIRSRLLLEKPGPGYMHYPGDRDANYFAQLVSERLVTKQIAGQRFRVWELPPGRANEALDMRVYAYAALCGLLHFGLALNRRADALGQDWQAPEEPEPVPISAVPAEPVPAAATTAETPQQPPRAAQRGPVIKVEQRKGRRRLAGRLAGA